METSATMPRQKETTIPREPAPVPDTMQQLLEAAWPHCGMIQEIIDRLNESGSNTELRLLTNRLQRLAFRAAPKKHFADQHPTGLNAWAGG
jgi:hypothetical protein